MNIAVIFAGGSGQRMKTRDIPKQFLEIHGKPIIIYTLEHFEKHDQIDAIVVACKSDYIDYMKELVYKYRIEKVKDVVPGGSTGQLSIRNGLKAAERIGGSDSVVLIHDGVRPMINEKLISDNIASVRKYGSAITTSVVKETILVVDDKEMIDMVPERANSRVAKAPQSFVLKDILEAHDKAEAEGREDFIDSCTMMKHYGYELHLVDGPYENIKITTPDDYFTLKAWLDAKEINQLFE